MKVLLVALLAGLVCVERALTLQCYTCKEPTDLSACTTVTNCSEKATACKTTVLSVDSGYPFFGNITVSKSCAETCVPSDPDGIGEAHPDSCCSTDLCNTDGAPGVRGSILGVTAAALWTLFRVMP
ncbi:ly6/PLAUR domain-containing protein 2-like [Pelodiscus sinensis]|uniref:ly6/PLAUR domain-containing protein 2-like n=1 Tax=Pelodiscus sinensis TaxID=13735 RepID=UPI0003C4B685|nr:ly6/PLAUR domain-containing protein 2-like [Pelodiscus sinensis]|eukprot:XP_006125999.1 ly6/PLAUR domain-containing protein 2-like [Pelodiscus sinensis]